MFFFIYSLQIFKNVYNYVGYLFDWFSCMVIRIEYD